MIITKRITIIKMTVLVVERVKRNKRFINTRKEKIVDQKYRESGIYRKYKFYARIKFNYISNHNKYK